MKKNVLIRRMTLMLSLGVATAAVAQNSSNTATLQPANGTTYIGDGKAKPNRCGSQTPSAEWDAWFNQKVKEHKEAMANGKMDANATYTIPIVFHVIYGAQALGTFPNLSKAQITSQVNILNNDYKGVGFNTNQYALMKLNGHPAFYDYAVANSLPAPDNNGVVIANSGITFCMATKGPAGTTLAEPGIDRISYTAKGWADPASFSSINAFQAYIDGTVKPGSIWDPTKYFNVWLTDENQAVGLLGYSTFPSGTSLTGLSGGGSGNANATTDGCWVYAASCGDVGTLAPPYNLGRTLTHESGHYFGLRHVWGDGTCATDYCTDVPQAAQANFVSWPTAYPYNKGTCTSGTDNNSADGEMFMAFMDYSNDSAMWMFTTDQVTRMHTALAQCPDRSPLTAAANTNCTSFAAGITEAADLNNYIGVYPNPSDGHLFLEASLPATLDLNVEVVNTLGQVVFVKKESGVRTALLSYDLSSLTPGVYFIRVTGNGDYRMVKKIVIK
jgi:hypothetical protein